MSVERGRNNRLPAILGVLALVALAACAAPIDLSAVQTYASTTAQAGSSFAALAADFSASCERYNAAADYLINAATAPQAPTLVGDMSVAQITDAASIETIALQPGYDFIPPAGAPPAPAPTGSAQGVTCADAVDVGTAWESSNADLLSYVQALGNLANVTAIPTPNPSPLASPLAKIGVPAAAIQAGSSLLSTIAGFFNQQASQRDIRTFMAAVNPSMPGAVEALELADAYYSVELQDEFAEIQTQYAVFARTELANYAKVTGNSQTEMDNRASIAHTILATKAVTVSALGLINNQRQASAAYGAAVAQILKTHEQLYDASQRGAKLTDYLSIVQTTGAPVVTDLISLAKAVK